MKQEFDREIEALLRGHERRGAARVRGAYADAHLDADELSAFADGALPAAARARYTAHLADCDSCRRLATEIALASGVAEEIERRKAGAAARVAVPWQARIVEFFAPRAWRYAMPLVALLAVGTIALVLMKRVPRDGALPGRRDEAGIRPAQREEQRPALESEQQSSSAAQPQPNAARNTASSDAGLSSNDAGRPSVVGRAGAQSAPQSAGVAAGEAAGGVVSVPPRAEVRALPEVSQQPPAAPPTPVPTPLPSSAPAASGTAMEDLSSSKSASAQTREQAEAKKKEDGQAVGKAASRAASPEAKPREVPFAAGAPVQNNAPAPSRRVRPAAPTPAESEARSQRERAGGAGETRRVGGRSFSRRGGVWIDTAYDPAQATVLVRRGSEQYRALVGDEPGLGRIVESLGGEIIVVWKGRAYQFKP